jgi:acyl-CoA synthetase (NDP forming)
MNGHPIDIFMNPRSVTVIGVSRRTGEGSFNVIESMKQFGFRGKIYPVNPMAEEILSPPPGR